ncbi:MAG TPA: site-specific integrase [Xanthobacteraceae bacterium]|nr:site-specific integrase [Xanthobacteraceae bacterium]
MLGKITKTSVEKLAPGGEWLWDTQCVGFGARRQTDGVFYYIRYRFNGRQHVKSLGRHGPLTPDIARTTAKAKLGIVAQGADPFVQPLAVEAFGKEVRRYLDRKRATMKPRAYSEVERHLLNHAEPLHRLRLSEVDRRAVAALLAEIEDGRGPVARNRLRSSLSAFFAWALREGFIDANPVAGTGKAEEGGARERVLTGSELREVWLDLPQDQFGDILRLLILTAQRRDEIGWLQWGEVDLRRGMIVLRPERTKNHRLYELPLSRQAQAILSRQPRRKGRDFIFGIGKGGYSGWSDCKARLDEAIQAKRGPKAKPMPGWRLHDLRRTAATEMAELGTQPHIIEAILNHVSGHKAAVAGIYNRAKYLDPMRDALQRWADEIDRITQS